MNCLQVLVQNTHSIYTLLYKYCTAVSFYYRWFRITNALLYIILSSSCSFLLLETNLKNQENRKILILTPCSSIRLRYHTAYVQPRYCYALRGPLAELTAQKHNQCSNTHESEELKYIAECHRRKTGLLNLELEWNEDNTTSTKHVGKLQPASSLLGRWLRILNTEDRILKVWPLSQHCQSMSSLFFL